MRSKAGIPDAASSYSYREEGHYHVSSGNGAHKIIVTHISLRDQLLILDRQRSLNRKREQGICAIMLDCEQGELILKRKRGLVNDLLRGGEVGIAAELGEIGQLNGPSVVDAIKDL